MVYKDCFFFQSDNGIWVEYKPKNNKEPTTRLLKNDMFSTVKTASGKIKYITEYDKDGYGVNEYYPSIKCKVIQC